MGTGGAGRSGRCGRGRPGRGTSVDPEEVRVWQRRVLAGTEPVTVADLRLGAIRLVPLPRAAMDARGRGPTLRAAAGAAGPGRGVAVCAADRRER